MPQTEAEIILRDAWDKVVKDYKEGWRDVIRRHREKGREAFVYAPTGFWNEHDIQAALVFYMKEGLQAKGLRVNCEPFLGAQFADYKGFKGPDGKLISRGFAPDIAVSRIETDEFVLLAEIKFHNAILKERAVGESVLKWQLEEYLDNARVLGKAKHQGKCKAAFLLTIDDRLADSGLDLRQYFLKSKGEYVSQVIPLWAGVTMHEKESFLGIVRT